MSLRRGMGVSLNTHVVAFTKFGIRCRDIVPEIRNLDRIYDLGLILDQCFIEVYLIHTTAVTKQVLTKI
jgi:hypothetical protein